MSQSPDPGWLHWQRSPSRPTFRPPPGAVDAHCHVFGPAVSFPFAPERKYTPCDAGRTDLAALRDFLGFSRNVIVQATCHGSDNRALVDALMHLGDKARGVATVTTAVTDEELEDLHRAGVRGVRFNFVRRLATAPAFDDIMTIVARIRPLGWHVVAYFEAQDLAHLSDFLAALPVIVVIDHMGRADVSLPVDDHEFQQFVRLMSDHDHVWTKVSCPERLSIVGPTRSYEDVIPFARKLVEEFPERVLWGTDWPHPNMKSHMPDDGNLVDLIPLMAPDEVLRHRLLVDNPMQLYWGQ